MAFLTQSRAETGINHFLVQTGRLVCMYRSLNLGIKHFHCQNVRRCSRHGERLDHMETFSVALSGGTQCSSVAKSKTKPKRFISERKISS